MRRRPGPRWRQLDLLTGPDLDDWLATHVPPEIEPGVVDLRPLIARVEDGVGGRRRYGALTGVDHAEAERRLADWHGIGGPGKRIALAQIGIVSADVEIARSVRGQWLAGSVVTYDDGDTVRRVYAWAIHGHVGRERAVLDEAGRLAEAFRLRASQPLWRVPQAARDTALAMAEILGKAG